MSLLEKIFGDSKKEFWTQIAQDIGGKYIDGGFWKTNTLIYEHNEWKITLDTYTIYLNYIITTYTRMRALFKNKNNLYFQIYRRGFFFDYPGEFFHGIGMFLGLQNIIIGDQYFNNNFLVKGNDKSKIKRLLDSDKLKVLIYNQPEISIGIRDKAGCFGPSFPIGVKKLYFECVGVIKDKNELLNLFELFKLLLSRLERIDSS